MGVFTKIRKTFKDQQECITAFTYDSLRQMVDSQAAAIVLSRIKWKPSPLFSRQTEGVLSVYGMCAWIKRDQSVIVAKVTPVGRPDQSGFQRYYTATASNGEVIGTIDATDDDIVIVRNNTAATPTCDIVDPVVDMIAKTMTAINNLTEKSMTDLISTTSEEAWAKIQKIGADLHKMTPIQSVQVSEDDSITRVDMFGSVKDTASPIAILWDSVTKWENILYTATGYNNVATEKRERLIVDEVNANNEIIRGGFFGDMVAARQDAVNEAGAKNWGELTPGFIVWGGDINDDNQPVSEMVGGDGFDGAGVENGDNNGGAGEGGQ